MRDISINRIFKLMDAIENKTNKMYHEIDAVYYHFVMRTLDDKTAKYSYIINKLSKELDELNKK